MPSRHRTALGLACLLAAAVPVASAHAHSDKPVCRADDGASAARHREKADMYAHMSQRQAGQQQAMVCLVHAALEGDAVAQGKLGMMYARTGFNRLGVAYEPRTPDDGEAALYWLDKAVAQGDALGAFERGRLYEYGLAGAQDDAEALRLYALAKAGNYRDAGPALKRLSDRPAAEQRFMDKYQAAAEAGDVEAIRAIVTAYIIGDPLRQSYEKAAQWLRRAAEAGDSTAQSDLGGMYLAGAGVPRDPNLAVDWLIKASRGTAHRRDVQLILLYDSDEIDAAHKAAIKARADEAGGKSFTEAAPAPQFDARPDMTAVESKAAKGDADAQYTMGIFYLGVFGDPVDALKAIPWLKKAADQDVASAAVNLAGLYYAGKQVPQDFAEALRWYEKAASLGDNSGLYNAAVMYRDGQGTAADPQKAYTLVLRIFVGPGMGDRRARALRDKLAKQITVEDRARCQARANEMYLAHY